MGPLVTEQHRDKVAGYIDARRDGRARSSSSMAADSRMQGYENGFFMGGTLFDHVTPDMRIYKEEIFGPVLGRARARLRDGRAS